MAHDPRLQAVLDIARTLGSTLDLDQLLASIMRTVTRVVGCDRSTLYLVDRQTNELWSRVAQGPEQLEIRLAPGTGIAGWVADNGQSVRLDDAASDPRFSDRWDKQTGYQTTSLLCVPFRNAGGGVVGVMQCINKRGSGFTDEDRELLETIGGQCAVALENASLYQSLAERSSQLRHANEELQILVDVERALGQATDEGGVLVGALRQLVRHFQAPAGAALVRSATGSHVVVVRAHGGIDIQRVDPAAADDRISARAAPGPLLSEDALIADLPAHGLEAPLTTESGTLGLVQLNSDGGGFEAGGLRILGLVANRMARAVEARRKEAERERSERLGLVGQMVSGILHDLRTPMSAVAGYAELMAEEDDPSEREYFAQRVASALRHMEAMTQEILQYARGTSDLVIGTVPLQELVADVQDMLRPELEQFTMDLVVQGDLDHRVRLDAGKVRRVIFNLARNAGQAGATLFLWRVQIDEHRLWFELVDDGPGLPDELSGRLFQPFATHGKSGGTGLGLAMVKGIVDAHGGHIEVQTVAGDGTTFRIALPLDPLTGTPLF